MSIDLQPGDHRIGKKPPEATVIFRIAGDEHFDHEELTRRLGIQPTKAWRAGDLKRPNQPPSPTGPALHEKGGWSVRVGSRPVVETASLFLELLELMAAAPPALVKDAIREMELEAWVVFGVIRRDEDFWPLMEVPLEFIEWMAAVGVALEMDFIA